jgi:hypothetical protein
MLSVSGFAFCNRAGACSEPVPAEGRWLILQNEPNPDRVHIRVNELLSPDKSQASGYCLSFVASADLALRPGFDTSALFNVERCGAFA